MPKIEIFPFVPEDLWQLYELETSTYQPDIALNIRRFRNLLANTDVFTFTAKTESKELVGGLIIKINKIHEHMVIISLIIKSQYRKQGIGKFLLNYSKHTAYHLKLKFIVLQIQQHSQGATRFFQKNGFQITKELNNFLKEGNKGYELYFTLDKNKA